MLYDYAGLIKRQAELAKFIKTGNIGKSVSGRDIPYFFVGAMNAPQTIICGGTHAREYITVSLSMLILELALERRSKLKFGAWIVPCVNPDGCELAMHGLNSAPRGYRESLVKINGGEDFSLYKANIRGVDINNNFPARWGQDPSARTVPAPSGYIGERAASEPETAALMRFTASVKPSAAVSYHSKGEVVYWDFDLSGGRRREHRRAAEIISASTGYGLLGNGASVGGYKDWCIQSADVLAFTVEVGSDSLSHPIGEDSLGDIYMKNKGILDDLEEMLLGRNRR